MMSIARAASLAGALLSASPAKAEPPESVDCPKIIGELEEVQKSHSQQLAAFEAAGLISELLKDEQRIEDEIGPDVIDEALQILREAHRRDFLKRLSENRDSFEGVLADIENCEGADDLKKATLEMIKKMEEMIFQLENKQPPAEKGLSA